MVSSRPGASFNFNNSILALLLFVLWCTFSGTCNAQQLAGKVVGVSDGDTITVLQHNQQYKIRLYGIDCPESGQAFGQKAKEFTSSMVFGKNVEVAVYDIDRYGRSVGVVHVDGTTVNEALLQNGYAWLYSKYCDQSFCRNWKTIEIQAAAKNLGLWAEKDQVPPWDWRKLQRGEPQSLSGTVATMPESSREVFHGNTRSHVFHSPSCQHYNCRNCTEAFKSAKEAVRAGYRKHEQCVNG